MSGPSVETLRPQALAEFDLQDPLRLDELAGGPPGDQALRLRLPGGPLLLLISTGGPLALAFEATLFDLLAEARFPAPRPRRSRGGSLIARLQGPRGPAAAACYGWPAGEQVLPRRVTTPQLLEAGRLLGRMHRLGEAHPASVPDPLGGEQLAARLPEGPEASQLGAVLRTRLPAWPEGALHGGLGPRCLLLIGDRASSVLPSGAACSGPWLVDVAEALVAWAVPAAEPQAALRALLSGYQALRRLMPGEREGLWQALQYAAAREGARRLLTAAPEPLQPLAAVQALGEGNVRAAAA